MATSRSVNEFERIIASVPIRAIPSGTHLYDIDFSLSKLVISYNNSSVISRLNSRIFAVNEFNLNLNTGGCLLSREKAVKDVNSRVGFCFLVGVILNFDWSFFS